MIFFSIIIPCFNVENYIYDTVQSVLTQQKVSDYEIILINDCSSDGTLSVINNIKRDYSQVKVISNSQNRGVSFSRNQGISLAKGKYLLFLDGDDFYESTLLKESKDVLLKKPDIDMFLFSFVKKYKRSSKSFSIAKYDKKVFSNIEFLEIYFRRYLIQCMCSFAIKREILTKNDILFSEDVYAGEDQEFQIRCYLNSKKLYYSSKNYFIYNYRQESIMNNRFNTKRISSLQVYDRIMTEISRGNIPKKFRDLFTTFSILEFFSVLRHGLKTKNEVVVKEILTYDTIVCADRLSGINKQSLIVELLVFLYRINPNVVLYFLK